MSFPHVDVTGAGPHTKELAHLVEKLLAGEGLKDVQVCISIVDVPTMVELNRRYTGRDGVTDVLAFSLREGQGGQHSHGHLGDVVICGDRATEQVAELEIDPDEELRRLVVHGVLHLLGYSHDDECRQQEMEALQEAYVEGRWDG